MIAIPYGARPTSKWEIVLFGFKQTRIGGLMGNRKAIRGNAEEQRRGSDVFRFSALPQKDADCFTLTKLGRFDDRKVFA